jgi:hypothetical protein
MLKNEAAGARHMSSNEYVHHYDEGAAEKLDSLYADFDAHRNTKSAKKVQVWITRNARSRTSKLGQILNQPETREYIETLRDFRPHFNVDSFFSIAFCIGQMHHINGGVSGTQTNENE